MSSLDRLIESGVIRGKAAEITRSALERARRQRDQQQEKEQQQQTQQQKVKLPPPLPPEQNIYDLGYAQRDKTNREMTEYARASEQAKTQTMNMPKKQDLSTQEYLQRTYDATQDIDRQLEEAQQLREWKPDSEAEYYTIPEEQYDPRYIHGPGSTRKDALDLYPDKPGVQLTPDETQLYMRNLGKEADEQLQLMRGQSQAAYVQALNLPKGTVIKETDKGYMFEMRDTSLDWTRQELSKIDKAYEINPLLGGVAEFGFGAVSGFAALAKPLAQYTLEKLGYDLKPVHYVSPIDVAFEPLGWSPKGSTDILRTRPIFSSGSLASEYLQTVSMSKAISLSVSSAAKGTKAVVKGASSLGKKIQPIGYITSKIGETGFGENIYKWAVKGYKPVNALSTKSTASLFKRTTDDTAETILSGGRKVEKTRLLSRTFVSPEDYLKMQSKLGKRVNIIFPRSEQLEATTFTSESRIKGIFRKQLITDNKIMTTRGLPISKNIDDYIVKMGDFDKIGKEYMVKGMPQTKTKMLMSADDIGDRYITRLKPYDATYRYFPDDSFTFTMKDKIDDVSMMFTSKERISFMLPKQSDDAAWMVYKKSVQPIQVIPGTRTTKLRFFTGPSMDDPMKAWAKAAKKHYDQPFKQSAFEKFLFGEQGTLEMIPQVQVLRQPKTLSWTRKQLTHETFTSYIPIRTTKLPVTFASLTGMKLGSGLRSESDLKNMQIGLIKQMNAMKQENDQLWRRAQQLERVQQIDLGQISMQDSASASLLESLQETMQQTKQELRMMSLSQSSTYTPVFKARSAYTSTNIYMPFPFYLPSDDGSSSKKKTKPVKFSEKGYRERKWRTITMKDILGLQRNMIG